MLRPRPEIEFYSAADGRRLAVRKWSPAGEPHGRIVLVHGVSSHSGWYLASCAHLAQSGLEVHFLDRRGSGLNPQGRGDVDSYETWIADVAMYLERLRDGRPPALCGISWGGKLAVAVARRRPDLVPALGLLCPGLFAYQEPGLLKRAALAAPLPARFDERRVKIPLRDPRLFTETPRWIEYVRRDPLSLREITMRFARADRRLSRLARQSAASLHMPMLLMLAGRDRIVNNRRTQNFLSRAASRSKKLVEYSTAAHTLEFEPDPIPIFQDLAGWLHAAVGACDGCGGIERCP